MRRLFTLLLAVLLAAGIFSTAGAQAAESIWMDISQGTYNPGDSFTVTLKAASATPIQGFTFQLRYDPACLQPEAPNSLLPGLNPISVPQSAGLVDAIFASPAPLNANGAIAEVKFKILAACQTTLNLENASLVVSDSSGIAFNLPGIVVGTRSATLTTGSGQVQPTQPAAAGPTSAPGMIITPPPAVNQGNGQAGGQEQASRLFRYLILPLLVLFALVLVIGLILVAVLGYVRSKQPVRVVETESLMMYIQRGPGAGTSLPMVVFPCRLGSDPENEIRLNDARVAPQHAQILAERRMHAVVDLGSPEGTYLNGRRLPARQPVRLKPGDALRMGGTLLVFSPLP